MRDMQGFLSGLFRIYILYFLDWLWKPPTVFFGIVLYYVSNIPHVWGVLGSAFLFTFFRKVTCLNLKAFLILKTCLWFRIYSVMLFLLFSFCRYCLLFLPTTAVQRFLGWEYHNWWHPYRHLSNFLFPLLYPEYPLL